MISICDEVQKNFAGQAALPNIMIVKHDGTKMQSQITLGKSKQLAERSRMYLSTKETNHNNR